ncbi:cytochrome o ubiquinol oxidase subunit III [Granulosicoccus antarcticus]|uniref:Cytochrome bo(3) ubiquinol oxidase subunit 3 n=1 Tax=Granulosicoccus antarcticus IMCC3135 TaxID=1192854 RepID=A0A2Z2P0N2_9GAMM|nr:cytochrome o ubiquinol oxidase subunit III [Granulosicoccus antarcticus]ASJ75688.1 Cytochrome bo(3) ubiquinol oxidase subunit 3 [Granulosicoccus antarcticus IMCC3135]
MSSSIETSPEQTRVWHLKEEPHHAAGHSTPLGFWMYLMSDCLIFAILFATYAVLGDRYGGGPDQKALFDLWLIALNTSMLLLSSITYGFAMLQMGRGNQAGLRKWLLITAAFGGAFLVIELYEFYHLIHAGYGPGRSAFLSSFFVLVGTHGLHVTFGIVWLFVLLAQIRKHGLTNDNRRRVETLSMFWHFLDVIWIGVFTVVYLMGAI